MTSIHNEKKTLKRDKIIGDIIARMTTSISSEAILNYKNYVLTTKIEIRVKKIALFYNDYRVVSPFRYS